MHAPHVQLLVQEGRTCRLDQGLHGEQQVFVDDALAEADLRPLHQITAHHAQGGLGEEGVALLEEDEQLHAACNPLEGGAVAVIFRNQPARLLVFEEGLAGKIQVVEALDVGPCDQLGKRFGHQVVVGVEQHQVFALGVVQGQVARGTLSAVFGQPVEAETPIPRRRGTRLGERIVLRPIIDADRLEVLHGLRPKRFHALHHVSHAVVDGDDYRNLRHRDTFRTEKANPALAAGFTAVQTGEQGRIAPAFFPEYYQSARRRARCGWTHRIGTVRITLAKRTRVKAAPARASRILRAKGANRPL